MPGACVRVQYNRIVAAQGEEKTYYVVWIYCISITTDFDECRMKRSTLRTEVISKDALVS